MSGAAFLLILSRGVTTLAPGRLSVGVGNNGLAAINVGTLSLTGASAFSIEADPLSNTTLAPGAQRQVRIRVATTTPGTYLGSLRIPSSDNDGTITVALLSTIAAALVPGMTVDPTGTIDFGSVDITSGASVRVFTVTSSGTGPLVMGTVLLTGTDYIKSTDGVTGVTLAPGASATVTVTLDPAAIGTKTGTLTIPATGVPSVVVNLTGVGTTGAPAPTPTLVSRFWLGRQASPVGPVASGGGWAVETTDADRLLGTTRGGPVVALGQTVRHIGVSGQRSRLSRHISPPLAAQTYSGTFLCYVTAQRSIYLGANVTSALRFGVWRAATSTVSWQGVLAMGSAASAWPEGTGPLPRRFPHGDPWSWTVALSILAGDRLVVEIGYRAFTTDASGATIRYGGSSATPDLTSTQSAQDLTYAPWIELSGGLLVLP